MQREIKKEAIKKNNLIHIVCGILVFTIIGVLFGLLRKTTMGLKDYESKTEVMECTISDNEEQINSAKKLNESLEKENNGLRNNLEEYKVLYSDSLESIDILTDNMIGLRNDLEYLDKLYIPSYSDSDIEVLCKTVYGEAQGCSKIQQAGVIWCVLNRVDAGWGDIASVCKADGQFIGYVSSNPVTNDIYALVVDVLSRWCREYVGEENVGRVLPSDYIYFYGDGTVNHFTTTYGGGSTWDWSWGSPY